MSGNNSVGQASSFVFLQFSNPLSKVFRTWSVSCGVSFMHNEYNQVDSVFSTERLGEFFYLFNSFGKTKRRNVVGISCRRRTLKFNSDDRNFSSLKIDQLMSGEIELIACALENVRSEKGKACGLLK